MRVYVLIFEVNEGIRYSQKFFYGSPLYSEGFHIYGVYLEREAAEKAKRKIRVSYPSIQDIRIITKKIKGNLK